MAETQKMPNTAMALMGERRRSERVMLVTNVTLIWTRDDGVRVRQSVESEVVSPHGALLRSKQPFVSIGKEVTLFNPRTNARAVAKVIGHTQLCGDGYTRFAVELETASIKFWGIAFPPGSNPDLKVGSGRLIAKNTPPKSSAGRNGAAEGV